MNYNLNNNSVKAASMTKQMVAAIANLITIGLFNTLAFKPIMEGAPSYQAYTYLLIGFIAFGLIFFTFTYFLRASIGCYIVGLEVSVSGQGSWSGVFLKRYSYFILFFLLNAAFFASQFELFYGHNESFDNNQTLRELMYSQHSIGNINRLLIGLMCVDYLWKVFSFDMRALREKWSETLLIDRYKIKL